MARMKRINITLDQETIGYLKRWKVATEKPASLVIREAVGVYTRWKKAELTPKPEEFEGVDVFEDGERIISLE